MSSVIDALQNKQLDLEKRIAKAEAMRDQLQLEVQSQSDPAWIELTLMRRLGLVPEGYTKIYLHEE